MENKHISRYPIPELSELPEDIRQRIEEVNEKVGFIPNIFLALAHRPAEFRAFFRLSRCDHGKGNRRPEHGRT